MTRYASLLALLLVVLLLPGCDFIGDVLEFGFWVGLVFVALIVLAGWLIYKLFD